jgi:hypothetical protein
MKTSFKLSKLLQERGFDEYSGWHWRDMGDGEKHVLSDEICFRNAIITTETGERECIDYPAYDIIYDICIKYVKELFGEDPEDDIVSNIITMLQQNKPQEEIEAYIIENLIN